MINETILAIIIAFAISAILCPIVIPFLHRLKFGQQVREEGPESSFEKAGYSHDGRPDYPDQHHHYFSVLREGLSEDHSDSVYDRWFWYCGFSG